ncbi:hypothetical protein RHODOSMS8_00022 [Rhodobiaceae bacterium]|nr:hypothetical protein RHODOSMS8_00022 [Rhodobiaceae bacterium]
MFWWLKEIFSSTRFLSIQGDNGFWKSKRMYEVVLPTGFTAIMLFLYCQFPDAFIADFITSITKNVFQFMVFVVPFHLAALGAFATFERQLLDEELKGTRAEIWKWSNTDHEYFLEQLTLRQYISLLFGYLCTLGIVFIIVYILLTVLDFQYLSGVYFPLVRDISIGVVLFFIAHYALLSIYGITFLFDKLNGLSRKP